jgi:hypothetical protein
MLKGQRRLMTREAHIGKQPALSSPPLCGGRKGVQVLQR